MIQSFADKSLKKCWESNQCGKIRSDLVHRVLMKLDLMDAATCLDDLAHPPSNHLHKLHGPEYQGCLAISVNGPWRLVFKFEKGDIFDVSLEQYH